VSFAGTARGIEARVLPREGFELDLIRSAGLKGKSIAARLRGGLLILPGLADAWRIVSRRRPDVVVGVGGYSAGPVVLVAALRGIPTMVLEQNAVPGLTNRVLARWVRAAAVAYPPTLPFFGGRGFLAGTPVRREFFDRPSADTPESHSVRILVLGGSQGAHAINMAMTAAAPVLSGRGATLAITHQTGDRDLALVRGGYRQAGLAATVEAFLDPVAPLMTSADLVVCRAGATTLAELAAAARPAILIPYPGATDDHQRRNARVVSDAGGALLLDERDLSGAALGAAILALADDPASRTAMSERAATFARPDAAGRIVDRLVELAAEARS
jgi:UDP-N-acetylglucosamine--N-acetylmuramyl-(pentapeptide) pyrophosphoryl-undecaprenol N-acetylglucosamine transferase